MSYWLTVTTYFQQINFYFVQIKFAKVLPWLFLNSRTIVCCINLIKYRLWLFPAKTFFSTKWWGQTEKRGHSFDYSWGSQELVWEKTFHDGSFNLIRDPRPLSIPTRIPRKLNKLHFQESCVCTHYIVYSERITRPAPKPENLQFSFYLQKKKIYSKAFQVQNLLFSNFYASMEKSENCHFKQ